MGKPRKRRKKSSAQQSQPPAKVVLDPAHPVTVQLPPPEGLAKWKPILDIATVAILLLSLVVVSVSTRLSWVQFDHAKLKADAADESLKQAQRAEDLSAQAQVRIAEYEVLLGELKAEISKTKELSEIGYLTLRAEGGDRSALDELRQRSSDDDWMITTVAEKNLSRVWAKFRGMEISDPKLASIIDFPTFTTAEEVERYISSPQYETRAQAINTARFLRLNYLIPKVLETALADSDLHVIQVACNTINELLFEPHAKWQLEERGGASTESLSIYDFVVMPDQTETLVLGVWNQRKDKLLAMQQKFWKPAGGGKHILVDPES